MLRAVGQEERSGQRVVVEFEEKPFESGSCRHAHRGTVVEPHPAPALGLSRCAPTPAKVQTPTPPPPPTPRCDRVH